MKQDWRSNCEALGAQDGAQLPNPQPSPGACMGSSILTSSGYRGDLPYADGLTLGTSGRVRVWKASVLEYLVVLPLAMEQAPVGKGLVSAHSGSHRLGQMCSCFLMVAMACLGQWRSLAADPMGVIGSSQGHHWSAAGGVPVLSVPFCRKCQRLELHLKCPA